MSKIDLKEIFNRTFDRIKLPSKGEFYIDKVGSFKIRYLSGLEEKVLSSEFLNETGEALELVLNNLIIDDFEVKDLIVSDLQGIMVFLYATAYGDSIPITSKCPKCGYEDDIKVRLSELDFKKSNAKPIDGSWRYYAPYRKNYVQKGFRPNYLELESGKKAVEIVLKPITFGRELEIRKKGKTLTGIDRVINAIHSIGGVEDRVYIEHVVKTMNMSDFKSFRVFSEENEQSIEDKVPITCIACGNKHEVRLNLGHDFLRLPENHRETVMEECFLISHYSESGMNFDQAMNLPVTERRWYLRRVSEELEKKREAEKKAADAAKSKSRSNRA